MNSCPCCSQTLLRQVRHQKISWFCRDCWQEMPLLPTTSQLSETIMQTA